MKFKVDEVVDCNGFKLKITGITQAGYPQQFLPKTDFYYCYTIVEAPPDKHERIGKREMAWAIDFEKVAYRLTKYNKYWSEINGITYL